MQSTRNRLREAGGPALTCLAVLWGCASTPIDDGTEMGASGGTGDESSEAAGGHASGGGGTSGGGPGVGAAAGAGGTVVSQASQYAGAWVGRTSGNQDLGFTVSDDGEVDSLIVFLRLSLGASTCTGPAHAFVGSHMITDGSFSIPVAFPGSNVTTTLEGSFAVDGTSATGSFAGFSGGFTALCGNNLTFGTGSPLASGTFSVTRGTLPCRWAGDGTCDEPQDGAYACVKGSDPLDCG
jgi:hypothetical protein